MRLLASGRHYRLCLGLVGANLGWHIVVQLPASGRHYPRSAGRRNGGHRRQQFAVHLLVLLLPCRKIIGADVGLPIQR